MPTRFADSALEFRFRDHQAAAAVGLDWFVFTCLVLLGVSALPTPEWISGPISAHDAANASLIRALDPAIGARLLHTTVSAWTQALGLPGGYLPALLNICLPLGVLLAMTIWWQHFVHHQAREPFVAGYRLAAAVLYLMATWVCSEGCSLSWIHPYMCAVSRCTPQTAPSSVSGDARASPQPADAAAMAYATASGPGTATAADSPGWQLVAPLMGPLLLIRAAALRLPWSLQLPVSVCEWVLFLAASQLLQHGQPWARGVLTGVDSLLTGVLLPALVLYLLEQRARAAFISQPAISNRFLDTRQVLEAADVAAPAASAAEVARAAAADALGLEGAAAAAAANGEPTAADAAAAGAAASKQPAGPAPAAGCGVLCGNCGQPGSFTSNHDSGAASVHSSKSALGAADSGSSNALARYSGSVLATTSSRRSMSSDGTAPDTPTSSTPEPFRRMLAAPGAMMGGIQLLAAAAGAGGRQRAGGSALYSSSHTSILISCKVARADVDRVTSSFGVTMCPTPGLTGAPVVNPGQTPVVDPGQPAAPVGAPALPQHPPAQSAEFTGIAQQLAAAARAAVIEAAAEVPVVVVSSEAITFPGCVQGVISVQLQQPAVPAAAPPATAGSPTARHEGHRQFSTTPAPQQLPAESVLRHLRHLLNPSLQLQQLSVYYFDDHKGGWEGWQWQGMPVAASTSSSSISTGSHLTAATATGRSSCAASPRSTSSPAAAATGRPPRAVSPEYESSPAPAAAGRPPRAVGPEYESSPVPAATANHPVKLTAEGWWVEPLTVPSAGHAPTAAHDGLLGATAAAPAAALKLHVPPYLASHLPAVRVVLGCPDDVMPLQDIVLPLTPGHRVVTLPLVALTGTQQLNLVVLTAPAATREALSVSSSQASNLASSSSSSSLHRQQQPQAATQPPAQLLAVLPLVAVPQTCCTELQQLFANMTDACEGVAYAAYACSFAPMLRDLSTVLAGPAIARHRGVTSPTTDQTVLPLGDTQQYKLLVADLLGYLEEQGLSCCCKLVVSVAQAHIKAAESTIDQPPSGAAAPRQVAAAAACQHAAVAEAAAAAVQQQVADAEAAVAEARAVLERTRATARAVSRQAAQAQHAARRAHREAAAAAQSQAVAQAHGLFDPAQLPDRVTVGETLWGWQQPGLEQHFQSWKAAVLLSQDRLALVIQLTRQVLLGYKVLQGVLQLASGLTLLLLLKYEVVTIAPYVVLLFFAGFFQRHRSAMLVLSQLAAAITTGMITATEVYRHEWQVLMTEATSNVVILQRPVMMAVWAYLVLPLLLSQSAGGQAVVCGALSVQSYLFYRYILYGGLSTASLLVWLAVGAVVAWLVGVGRDALLRRGFIKAVNRYRAAPTALA